MLHSNHAASLVVRDDFMFVNNIQHLFKLLFGFFFNLLFLFFFYLFIFPFETHENLFFIKNNFVWRRRQRFQCVIVN